jgi:hypothetical protein
MRGRRKLMGSDYWLFLWEVNLDALRNLEYLVCLP